MLIRDIEEKEKGKEDEQEGENRGWCALYKSHTQECLTFLTPIKNNISIQSFFKTDMI